MYDIFYITGTDIRIKNYTAEMSENIKKTL
jgi:hypothetical protein